MTLKPLALTPSSNFVNIFKGSVFDAEVTRLINPNFISILSETGLEKV